MYERYREHRTSSECDEEIDDDGVYFLKGIEDKPCRRYESKDEEGKSGMHRPGKYEGRYEK